MKINNNLDNRENLIIAKKNVNKESVQNFSKEFLSSLNEKSKKDMKELLESIKKKGSKLVLTKVYADVLEYKNLVKDYLKKVLEDMYSLDKCTDSCKLRYYLTVETIDKKLEELTASIVGEEKSNISILNTIDEIQGLMVDIYK